MSFFLFKETALQISRQNLPLKWFMTQLQKYHAETARKSLKTKRKSLKVLHTWIVTYSSNCPDFRYHYWRREQRRVAVLNLYHIFDSQMRGKKQMWVFAVKSAIHF